MHTKKKKADSVPKKQKERGRGKGYEKPNRRRELSWKTSKNSAAAEVTRIEAALLFFFLVSSAFLTPSLTQVLSDHQGWMPLCVSSP
jgi:hypothetical protein